MRLVRAVVGALGASGSLIAATAVLLAILTTGLAFHAWPEGPDAGGSDFDSTEIVGEAGPRVQSSAGAAATPSSGLPGDDGARVGDRTAAAGRLRRDARGRRRVRARREAGTGRVPAALAVPGTPAPGTRSRQPVAGPDTTTSGGGPATTPQRAPVPSLGDGTTPSLPQAPNVPQPPPVPGPGQPVQDVTQVVGDAVQGVTGGAGEVLRPVSPALADTVGQAREVADQTISQTVGGLLGAR